MGALVQGDLEAAKSMAMRMDMFHGGSDSGGGKQQKGKSGQPGKKGAVQAVETHKAAEPSKVAVVMGDRKGKGSRRGKKGKNPKDRGPVKCFNCGGDHPLRWCLE